MNTQICCSEFPPSTPLQKLSTPFVFSMAPHLYSENRALIQFIKRYNWNRLGIIFNSEEFDFRLVSNSYAKSVMFC